MRRVIVFGGSFSPPTLAHEAIIAECLKLPGFDEIWLMPSADRQDKVMSASEADRLAMLYIVKAEVFKNNERLQICDIEYNLPKPTKLCATEKVLRKQYPNTTFWFAFGGDAYRDMPNWPEGDRLQKELNLIVFSDLKPQDTNNARVLHIKLPAKFSDMSSTQARATKGPNRTVSAPVIAYIEKVKLY